MSVDDRLEMVPAEDINDIRRSLEKMEVVEENKQALGNVRDMLMRIENDTSASKEYKKELRKELAEIQKALEAVMSDPSGGRSSIKEEIDDITKDMTELKTLLKGYNGFPGLLKDIKQLESDFTTHLKNQEGNCIFKKVGEVRLIEVEKALGSLAAKPARNTVKVVLWAAAIIGGIILTNLTSYGIQKLFEPKTPIEQTNEDHN